jgi:hypothetical protein
VETENGAATTAARECHDWREEHEHNRSCGPCKECRGTGKDLISYIFRSKKTRAKCAVCKGTRIRSQEFELSNQITMEELIKEMFSLVDFEYEEMLAHYHMVDRAFVKEALDKNDGSFVDDNYRLEDYAEELWDLHASSSEKQEEQYVFFDSILTLEKVLDLDNEIDRDLYLWWIALEEDDEKLLEEA